MNERRGPWYLITGLVIGLAIGVVYAWVIQPAAYQDSTPEILRAEGKDRYRALIALSYVANGDLVRAKARLDLLKDADVRKALEEQAQRTTSEGGAEIEAQALARLAADLEDQ